MRNFLLLILILIFSFSLFAQDQIFDSSITDQEGFFVSDVLELENNQFLLLTNYGNYNQHYKTRFFVIDGTDGNVLEDEIHSSSSIINAQFIERVDNEYIVFGYAQQEIDVYSLYYARFTLDFDIIEEFFYPIESSGVAKMQVELVNNQLIFMSASFYNPFFGSFGGIISLTGELILLNEHLFGVNYLGDFLIRKDSVGYIGFTQRALVFMDESFNKLHGIVYEESLFQYGSLKYLEDTTILFVSKYWHKPDSINNSRDIGVGIFDDFEISNLQYFGTINSEEINADTVEHCAVGEAMDFIDENNIYVAGVTNFTVPLSAFPPATQFIVANYDRNLNKRWEKRYGDNIHFKYMRGVLATSDGGALLYGYTFDNNSQLRTDIYIVKIAGDGTVDSETVIPVNNAIKVFPNPATDFINLEFPKNIGQQLSLRIYSITGQIMMKNNKYQKDAIDIQQLPKGNYLLELVDLENSKQFIQKIIKQ